MKENLVLKPKEMPLQSIGQLEGYTHQATLVYVGETSSQNKLIDAIRQSLSLQDEVTFGVSALPVNGIIVRVLGNKAEELFTMLQKLAEEIELFKRTTIAKPVVYV